MKMPVGAMSAREASKRLGVTHGAISYAIKNKQLAAVQISSSPARWAIFPDDLAKYEKLETRRPNSIRWTDGMDEILVESAAICTYAQLAAFFECSSQAIHGRLKKLRRNGITAGIGKGSGAKHKRNAMPSTAILLAKTCTGCGKLRDAKHYTRRSNGCYPTVCRRCKTKHEIGKYDRGTPEYRRKIKALNDITRARATRWHYEWTDTENKKLQQVDKGSFMLALELGRTVAAVRHQRARLGIRVREPLPDDEWIIRFTKSTKAIQDGFIRLGVPDDGWDD